MAERQKEQRRNELYKRLHDTVTDFVENGGEDDIKGGVFMNEASIKAVLDLAQALNQPKDNTPVVVTTLKSPNTTNKLLSEIRKTICILQDYESRVYATLLNNDIDLSIAHTFVTYHMTDSEASEARIPILEQKRGRKTVNNKIVIYNKRGNSPDDDYTIPKKRRKSNNRPPTPKPQPTENEIKQDIKQKQTKIILDKCQKIGLEFKKVMEFSVNDLEFDNDVNNENLRDFVTKNAQELEKNQSNKQTLKLLSTQKNELLELGEKQQYNNNAFEMATVLAEEEFMKANGCDIPLDARKKKEMAVFLSEHKVYDAADIKVSDNKSQQKKVTLKISNNETKLIAEIVQLKEALNIFHNPEPPQIIMTQTPPASAQKSRQNEDSSDESKAEEDVPEISEELKNIVDFCGSDFAIILRNIDDMSSNVKAYKKYHQMTKKDLQKLLTELQTIKDSPDVDLFPKLFKPLLESHAHEYIKFHCVKLLQQGEFDLIDFVKDDDNTVDDFIEKEAELYKINYNKMWKHLTYFNEWNSEMVLKEYYTVLKSFSDEELKLCSMVAGEDLKSYRKKHNEIYYNVKVIHLDNIRKSPPNN